MNATKEQTKQAAKVLAVAVGSEEVTDWHRKHANKIIEAALPWIREQIAQEVSRVIPDPHVDEEECGDRLMIKQVSAVIRGDLGA